MLGVTRVGARQRAFIAVMTLCLAALLFRGQLASALVSRGDEFVGRGDVADALRYYGRAMRFDPDSATAADRFIFFDGTRSASGSTDAIGAATEYLHRHPNDALVLSDRALCYERARRYELAAKDFSSAARLTNDPREYTFGGWAALRSGHGQRARTLWLAALRLQPSFRPAQIALRKSFK